MLVMPANSTGRFWDPLARETQLIGHLLSPTHHGWPVPRPWIPYALDNGAFSCWDRKLNQFSEVAWSEMEPQWRKLIEWASLNTISPIWAIVPDVPGNAQATLARWERFAPSMPFTRAVAVQDGMSVADVRNLWPAPSVICVGGTDGFKKNTWRDWTENFPRVHVLRVNSLSWLKELDKAGVESCDGTGWNRGNHGNRATIQGLEEFLRERGRPSVLPLWPYVCAENRRATKQGALLG